MTLVTAIQVLFAENAPAGADFEGAYNALKGKKDTDLSHADATTLDALAETFQDFVGDPTDWIKKASATDPRHSWWVKLAQELGVTVKSVDTPATPPSTAGLTAAPAVAEPEPEQGIDPDALAGGAPAPSRREGGGSPRSRAGGGVVVSTGDDYEDEPGDRPSRERRPSETPRPLVPLFTRPASASPLSAVGEAVLATARYQKLRDRIIAAFLAQRMGKRNQKTIANLKQQVAKLSYADDLMASATGSHLFMMIRDIETGVDLRRPSYFDGMYKTGKNDTD